MKHQFRAWDIELKIMVNSYQKSKYDTNPWDGVWNSHWGMVQHCLECNFIWMLHIGLKDKNDVYIYEDDILIDNVGRKWMIKYCETRLAFAFYYLKDINQSQLFSRFNSEQKPFIIIGNIHENPKLFNE